MHVLCLLIGIGSIYSSTVLIVSVIFSHCRNGWRHCNVHYTSTMVIITKLYLGTYGHLILYI